MLKELRKLLVNLRPYKKYLAIIAITGIMFGLTYSRLGLIVKALFDDLSAGRPKDVFNNFLIALSCALISAVCRYYHIFLMNYVGEMIVQGLREQLQQKFMRLSLSYHSKYEAGSGGLISRIFQ